MIRLVQSKAYNKIRQMEPADRRLVPREDDTQELKMLVFDYMAFIMRDITGMVSRCSNSKFFMRLQEDLNFNDLTPTLEREAVIKGMTFDDFVNSLTKVNPQDIDTQLRRIEPRIEEAKRVLAIAQNYAGIPMSQISKQHNKSAGCTQS